MFDKKVFDELEHCLEVFKGNGHSDRVGIPMSAFEFLINTVKEQQCEIEQVKNKKKVGISMKMYGVVLTNNFNDDKVIDFLRFETKEEAEKCYQEYKQNNIGVVKVEIEKAHQFKVLTSEEMSV
jgi:hypothetical protein